MSALASSPIEKGKTRLNSAALDALDANEAESWDSEKILTWAIRNFHPRLALSCSFGNPEGLVLIDMMHRIEPSSRVYVLDTGRLHQATYDLIDRVRERYDKEVEVIFPEAAPVQAMVQEHGMNLFYESLEKRRLCCDLRKVQPNKGYLAGLDAHVTGLRREQNVTREAAPKVEVEASGLVKINPLVDWTHDDVWAYVRKHTVPVNRLHAEGFTSVGCGPCTRAIQPGDDPRAGRWWWENADTKECGLHVDEEAEGSGI